VTECNLLKRGECKYDRDTLRAALLQSSRFLTTAPADQTIPPILATIGEALQVDRVLVAEKTPGDPPGANLCYAWQMPNVPQVTAAFYREYPSTSPEILRWLAPLLAGEHVAANADQVKGAVAELFRKLETRSVLRLPILIGCEIWGGIGVDTCKEEREWTLADIDLLKILANMIGTTIIRERYERLLSASEQKFRAVAEAALDAMIMIDAAGKIQYWNPAAMRILGYSAEEAVGTSLHQLIVPPIRQDVARAGLQRFQHSGTGPVVGNTHESIAIRKDGIEIPIELSIAPVGMQGKWCAIGILRDISRRKEAETKILWLARNDVLTGLPNRTVFVEEVEQALIRYRRSGERFAVFYLDLDHFKDVNDTLGHPVGDLLLREAAERLRSTLRNIDTIARFGGDEFAILATQLTELTDAGILAGKLVAAMAKPFLIGGTEIHSGVSIGVATCKPEEANAEVLLSHADVALYRAKSEERGSFRFFTDELHDEVRRRVNLLTQLRRGIEEDELTLFYQPQVNMVTRQIVGVEALVRWRHRRFGLIPPSHFISAAEHSGLTIQLGRFVLYEACRQTRRWLDMGIDVPLMAVNVSPMQFKAPSQLNDEVYSALAETRLKPELLEIELTESALMLASRENSRCLLEMREKGVRLAIDDFGTGYSCFDYLRRFPASRLKIAQTFVADIAHSPSSASITRAAINLGHELGVGLIAEGVETERQQNLLLDWGCRDGQGYYFARPLSASRVTEFLRLGKAPLPEPEGVLAEG
jgi:diguanylate cyclase (GGDEF)-like protein/PAS domain S-box-containing protein